MKNGDGTTPKRRCDKASSLPRLFIKAIKIAGTIPTNGPISGIKFANPAIIPMKTISVKLAPAKLSTTRPKTDKTATLAADRNCPRR